MSPWIAEKIARHRHRRSFTKAHSDYRRPAVGGELEYKIKKACRALRESCGDLDWGRLRKIPTVNIPARLPLFKKREGVNQSREMQLCLALMHVGRNGGLIGTRERKNAANWLKIKLKSVKAGVERLAASGQAEKVRRGKWRLKFQQAGRDFIQLPLIDRAGRSVLERGYCIDSWIIQIKRERGFPGKDGKIYDPDGREIPVTADHIPARTRRYRQRKMRRQKISPFLIKTVNKNNIPLRDYRPPALIELADGRKIPWFKTKRGKIRRAEGGFKKILFWKGKPLFRIRNPAGGPRYFIPNPQRRAAATASFGKQKAAAYAAAENKRAALAKLLGSQNRFPAPAQKKQP